MASLEYDFANLDIDSEFFGDITDEEVTLRIDRAVMESDLVEVKVAKIPPRLVSVILDKEKVTVKRAHWTSALNKEMYECEIRKPWVLTKVEVLEEIQWSLTTSISKSLFSELPDGAVRYNENCRISGLSQGVIGSLLNSVMPAIKAHQRMDRFVMHDSCVSPTLISLRAYLSDYLVKWRKRILEIPLGSILQCDLSLRPLIEEISIVFEIVEPTITRATSRQDYNVTDSFIDECYRATEQLIGVGGIGKNEKAILLQLLSVAASPWVSELSRWINGKDLINIKIDDRNGPYPLATSSDFFIEIQDDANFKYSLRPVTNSLFSGFESDLLGARKSVLILKGMAQNDKSDSLVFWSLFENAICSSLDDQFALCSKALFDALDTTNVSPTQAFRDCLHRDVTIRCTKVKTTLMAALKEQLQLGCLLDEMKNIVTTSALSDLPFERQLDHLIDYSYLRRYIGKVNERFFAQFKAGDLKFRWRLEAKEHQFPNSKEKMWILNLKIQIPYPLTMVITDAHVISYQHMFRFFLDLECARNRLARLQLKELAPTGTIGRRLSVLRFELCIFLMKMTSAISHKFNWQFNVDKVLEASSIDELFAQHDRLVTELSKVLLLDETSNFYATLMRKLIGLSNTVEGYWTNAFITESDMNESRLAFDASRDFFGKLLSKRYEGNY